MKSMLNTKNLIAIVLILFGIVLYVQNTTDTVIDNDQVAILDIKKPSESVLNAVTPVSKLITDPTDRARLAIFNQEFANRILGYTTDNQKTNDVYVLAAKHFFNSSLSKKYAGLDSGIVEILKSSIGEENHILSQQEKEDVSNKFMGLAWSLIQKQ